MAEQKHDKRMIGNNQTLQRAGNGLQLIVTCVKSSIHNNIQKLLSVLGNYKTFLFH